MQPPLDAVGAGVVQRAVPVPARVTRVTCHVSRVLPTCPPPRGRCPCAAAGAPPRGCGRVCWHPSEQWRPQERSWHKHSYNTGVPTAYFNNTPPAVDLNVGVGQKTLDYEHVATLGCDVERSPAVLALDVDLRKLESRVIFLPRARVF